MVGCFFHFLFRVIDHACLRSFVSLFVHVCVAVALGALFYFGEFVGGTVSDNSLVTILAGIAAVSGGFLALTLAFGTFESQFHTDWTYRNYERLRNQREKMGDMMRKAAGKYPAISRYLKDRYFFMSSYLPGQPVNLAEMAKSDIEFRSWVDEQVEKSGKKIDWGNIDDYETFVKHAVDAMFIADESREVFAEVVMAGLHGQTLRTLPPVIMTWGLILASSLVFAVTSSLDVMPDRMNLSMLIMPIYLSFVAVIALVIDFGALMKRMRIREAGWEMARRDDTRLHWSERYK
jgi:hypothetical protein